MSKWVVQVICITWDQMRVIPVGAEVLIKISETLWR